MEKVADEKLPQLDLLLDAASLQSIYDQELISARGLATRLRIDDCQIIRVKYRPGKYCLITTEIKLSDLKNVQVNHQAITLWCGGEGESAMLFDEALCKQAARTDFGDGIFHLPELGAVGWVFPNDLKLTGLPSLFDENTLKNDILPEIVALSSGEDWQVSELKREVVHYVAARSCTVRVSLNLRRGQTDERQSAVLFGKTYCLSEGEAAWRGMRFLWESEARQEGRLLIPEPLAYQPRIKTLWQRGLAGENLFECESSPRYSELLAQAGAAVATLHRIPVSTKVLPEAAAIDQKLIEAQELISRFRPAGRDDLKRLVHELMAANERIGNPPKAMLHGDLHLKNFFLTNDRVALIDLDNFCLGDPWQELGSFTAAIYYQCLVEGRSLQVAEQTLRPFLRAYRDQVDWEVSDATLNLRTAAALIYERVYRCLTRLTPGWPAIVDDLFRLAEMLARKK